MQNVDYIDRVRVAIGCLEFTAHCVAYLIAQTGSSAAAEGSQSLLGRYGLVDVITI